MSQWKVVLLVVIALGGGVAFGYAVWGSKVGSLSREVDVLREEIDELKRQLQAREAGGEAGSQRWEAHGVVREVYPQLLLISHEEIAGFLPAKTSGFRLAGGLSADVGDAIRFWIHGSAPHNSVLVELEALDTPGL